MGPSWHARLVYWSIFWPLPVYAVLHARNWYSNNHWYTPIYPKGTPPKKTTTYDYLQQAIGDIIEFIKNPPKTLPFWSYGDAKKCDQSDCPHLAHKHISTTHINITLSTTAATDSKCKFPGSEYPQHTRRSSEGGTSLATSEGENTSAGTLTIYNTITFHIT